MRPYLFYYHFIFSKNYTGGGCEGGGKMGKRTDMDSWVFVGINLMMIENLIISQIYKYRYESFTIILQDIILG